jgi:6-phosphofructokinase 2
MAFTQGSPTLLDGTTRALSSTPLALRSKQAGLGILLLKPSLRELTDLTGREIHNERDEGLVAGQVIKQGRCEILVLSLGAQGALLATAEGCERFAAIPVDARSTVGAGDSMLAGIVLGLSRGLPLRDSVHFGMAAGAAALLGSGTPLCRRNDVERLYAEREYLPDV